MEAGTSFASHEDWRGHPTSWCEGGFDAAAAVDTAATIYYASAAI